jgi:hypothetical protein
MLRRSVILVALLACAGTAWAADPPKGGPTPEMRREMAGAHRKLADCLESDRPFGECREEMMKRCRSLMGEEGCPMMGHGGMHGRGMMPSAPPAEKPAK